MKGGDVIVDKRVLDAKAKILVLRPNNDIRIISPPPLGDEFVLHHAGGLLFDDKSVELRVNGKIVNMELGSTETLDEATERLLKPFRKREIRALKKSLKTKKAPKKEGQDARRRSKPVNA